MQHDRGHADCGRRLQGDDEVTNEGVLDVDTDSQASIGVLSATREPL